VGEHVGIVAHDGSSKGEFHQLGFGGIVSGTSSLGAAELVATPNEFQRQQIAIGSFQNV
jgi:hypothetical protein